MHLVTPTQAETKRMTSFQCSCCKSLECVKFLHSVLAVAAAAVSFGTCTLLWYGAKQEEEQPRPKQKQKLYTYLIRSLNIGSLWQQIVFCSIQPPEREKIHICLICLKLRWSLLSGGPPWDLNNMNGSQRRERNIFDLSCSTNHTFVNS